MESKSFNKELIRDILSQIEQAISTVEKRTAKIHSADDFLSSPMGMIILDAVCMQFIAIGESLKSLDKETDYKLLNQYPNIPWRKIKGLRDIIAHHYFNVDVDMIIHIIRNELNPLKNTILQIIDDLGS